MHQGVQKGDELMGLFIFILKWAKSKCKFQTLPVSCISSRLALLITKIQIWCTDLRTCTCNSLVTVLRCQVLAEVRHVFIYRFTHFSHRLRPGGDIFFLVEWATNNIGDIFPSAQEGAIYCHQILEKGKAIPAWYTIKCLLTWLSHWTVVFLWIHLPMGEPFYHCIQPPVTLLQIPDTLLLHPYCILKSRISLNCFRQNSAPLV